MEIVIVGGSLCGLTSALLLARSGHEVTVLERDAADIPNSVDDAWDWSRRGVTQFRQAHYYMARYRQLLMSELPDVVSAFEQAGARTIDPLENMPPTVDDRSPRPGDEDLLVITARRPVLEKVLAEAAANDPGIAVRRGTGVAALLTGPAARAGAVHVTGVRTENGTEIAADLVVDASGRRSALPRWLDGVGARPLPEVGAESGYTYYTRFYEPVDGAPGAGFAQNVDAGSVSVLILPNDRGWSNTLFTASNDAPLRRAKVPAAFDAVMELLPVPDGGRAVTDVMPMAAIDDRWRRHVDGDGPVATGVVAVGDAWACTNPALGRGVSMAMLHSVALRDLLQSAPDDPAAVVEAWDAVTEERLTPWYEATTSMSNSRLAEMQRIAIGAPDSPASNGAADAMRQAFFAAAMFDADVYRALVRLMNVIVRVDELFADPGLFEKILAVAADVPAQTLAGPTREKLLAALG